MSLLSWCREEEEREGGKQTDECHKDSLCQGLLVEAMRAKSVLCIHIGGRFACFLTVPPLQRPFSPPPPFMDLSGVRRLSLPWGEGGTPPRGWDLFAILETCKEEGGGTTTC